MQEEYIKETKPTEDMSGLVEETIEECNKLLGINQSKKALERFFATEKKVRSATDAVSASKLFSFILFHYKSLDDWDDLIDMLTTLSKRRSQLKRPIIEAVNLCIGWADPDSKDYLNLPSLTEDKLLQCLANISQGKIFIEVERARAVRLQSNKLLSSGDVKGAATLLAEIQPEAFQWPDPLQQVEYLVHQMEVCMLTEDFIRCQIISKKIHEKTLEKNETRFLKLKYHELMKLYFLHNKDFWNVACAQYKIYKLHMSENEEEAIKSLKCYIGYLLLSEINNEVTDALGRLKVMEEKQLQKIPCLSGFVSEILDTDIICWPPPCLQELKEIYKEEDENTLRIRIIQHNVLVIQMTHKRIGIERLAELLETDVNTVEDTIAFLVRKHRCFIRIDRPQGLVIFERPNSLEPLSKIEQDFLLAASLIEETTQLIQKERMINQPRI